MALHPPGFLWIAALVGDEGGERPPSCFSSSAAGEAGFHGQEGLMAKHLVEQSRPKEPATGPVSRPSAASPIMNRA